MVFFADPRNIWHAVAPQSDLRRTQVPAQLLGVSAIAVGLVLNPWLLGRLLFGQATGGPRAFHAAFWVVEAVLVALGVLVVSRRITASPRVAGWLMGSFVCVFVLGLTVAADRVWGMLAPKKVEGLIFPPGSAVTYTTTEFDVVVRVNSLGFRGPECAREKSLRRIAAIGDSFTLGWGVNIEDAWVTRLANASNAAGPVVEVLDLGQGGAYPRMYADTAHKAIPTLKPDLVLIAILEGDDLFQTVAWLDRGTIAAQRRAAAGEPSALDSAIGFVRGRLLRNFLNPRAPLVTSVRDTWRPQAKGLVGWWTPEERARFDGLDAGVKDAFFDGTLNPILIHNAIASPDFYTRHADPASPDARRGIKSMAESLRSIRDDASRSGATAKVVIVPYRAYVSRRDLPMLRRLGYVVPDSLASSDGPDDAIRQAASSAGLECLEFTNEFRAASAERELYYPLDGHFNPAGNELFARVLAAALAK